MWEDASGRGCAAGRPSHVTQRGALRPVARREDHRLAEPLGRLELTAEVRDGGLPNRPVSTPVTLASLGLGAKNEGQEKAREGGGQWVMEGCPGTPLPPAPHLYVCLSAFLPVFLPALSLRPFGGIKTKSSSDRQAELCRKLSLGSVFRAV